MESIDEQVAGARAAADYRRIDALLGPVVERARQGEKSGVDDLLRLIDRHRLAIAPIRKLLIDDDDVEDAAQNTLMAVTRAIGSFEGRSRFTTWLYTVAEREALQILRRNKRVVQPGGEDFSGIVEDVRHMSSMVATQEMIRQVLAELDPSYRDPVVLCDVDQLEYQTIADQMGLPINTVKTRIRRGRQMVADRVIELLNPR